MIASESCGQVLTGVSCNGQISSTGVCGVEFKMKLKGMTPTGDNPLGATSSILGGILGQNGKTGKGQQQQNPVNQILDIFSKKKNQP